MWTAGRTQSGALYWQSGGPAGLASTSAGLDVNLAPTHPPGQVTKFAPKPLLDHLAAPLKVPTDQLEAHFHPCPCAPTTYMSHSPYLRLWPTTTVVPPWLSHLEITVLTAGPGR